MTAPEPFTDEDIEKYAAELLGLPQDDNSDTVDDSDVDSGDGGGLGDDAYDAGDATDDGEEGEDSEGSITSDLSPSPVDPTSTLDPATLLSYAQFDAILKARPDARQFFQDIMERGETAVAPASPSSPPALPSLPELDDDALADPAIRALYESNRATLDALAAERQRVDALTNATTIRTQQEFTTRAMEAKANFATSHNLDPTKVEAIAQHADELGVSRSLLANTTDITTAVSKALELAMWDMPEYRADAIDNAVKDRTTKHRKRQKLAGVGGGSGSTPRDSAPKPLSQDDLRKAMIADVADQWFGQPQPEG